MLLRLADGRLRTEDVDVEETVAATRTRLGLSEGERIPQRGGLPT